MVFPNTAPRTKDFFKRALAIFGSGHSAADLFRRRSPALLSMSDYPMMTEHRAGTYVYNDVMMVHSGIAQWEDCAMHVRATVVSRPTDDRAVIDAGSKVLTSDKYYVENHAHRRISRCSGFSALRRARHGRSLPIGAGPARS